MPSVESKWINDCGPYLYLVESYRDPATGRPKKRRKYLGKVQRHAKNR
jgi:hypothetical protein